MMLTALAEVSGGRSALPAAAACAAPDSLPAARLRRVGRARVDREDAQPRATPGVSP